MFKRLLPLLVFFPITGFANPPATPSELIQELMSIWRTGDTASLQEIFADDAVYVDTPNNVRLVGLEQAAGYVTHIHSWATDVEVEVGHVMESDDGASAEWVMRATQSAPIGALVPIATNRPVTITGITVIQTRNGKIVRAADYLDALGFVLQLGATVELPGGTKLGELSE